MLGRLANGGPRFRGGIERGARVYILAHTVHPLALSDRLLEVNRRFLAVGIRRGQQLQDRLGMTGHLPAVMKDRLGVSHPSMHDHVLSIPEHGGPMFLHLFRRCTERNRHQSSARKDKSKRKQRGFH